MQTWPLAAGKTSCEVVTATYKIRKITWSALARSCCRSLAFSSCCRSTTSVNPVIRTPLLL